MRLRLEFTTEPFDLEGLPPHARATREVLAAAPLDTVDVGPFGNTVEGAAEQVLAVLDQVCRRALEAGASRVSLQLSTVDAAPEAPAPGGGGAADGRGGR
ncbi:thiamine-binding protein [Allostreptomyces psammosilenae]|uniref:Thiamine-binding protein domain-containing protein n=1 Tax=Allostreptomyces psammosilenae TaxID=1892865 RepID=A0A853ACS4_9ACTN|nr:thiamine-binding protein [Allostreptomyces psammosilenae]NYI08351.1 hypothetical protein [Allostreptomyces psammosilenae]